MTRVAAERARELHRRRVGARHLRRGVDRQRRRDGADELRDAEVLHDDRVDRRVGARAHGGLEARQLVVEDQRVQRDVALRRRARAGSASSRASGRLVEVRRRGRRALKPWRPK